MMSARSRSEACATTSAALGPSLPMRMSSGPSSAEREAALGLVELHRRHAEIEHDAVDRRDGRISPRRGRDRRSDPRPASAGHWPTRTRSAPLATALWSRSMPMTCASAAARIARRVAAGAEGAVDIDAAVADIEMLERRPREHGNVTGQSASDSRCRRCPPSFPCSERVVRRLPEPVFSAHRPGGLRELRAERSGSQIENDRLASAGTTQISVHRPCPSTGYAQSLE